MSGLSGFDSDAVGFESISQTVKSETSSGTQTSLFSEAGTESQTNISIDWGSLATPEDLGAQGETPSDYSHPGLNEFLRRVVPGVMEQLEQTDKDFGSSDSEDEEVVVAKLFQELKVKNESLGSGDHELAVLSVSWSSGGNSVAMSLGHMQHENWCEHDGIIKVFTIKRAAEDKFVHTLDINEKNCVSVVKYHPTVAAVLAYGTTSGEVVISNLLNAKISSEMQLTSPAGCHGSRRVSSMQWADPHLCNIYLVMQINLQGRRRGASDQVLITSGSDGTINVWQVNSTQRFFQNIISYAINGSRKMAAPDITCFDFSKSYPLRPFGQKTADDVFVVGTKSGSLYLCKMESDKQVGENTLDPVYEMLDGHGTCVVDIAFNAQKPGVFMSISIDSELRIYDVKQASPLKVLCLDVSISCMSWLPTNPWLILVGLASGDQRLKLFNLTTGRAVTVDGFAGDGNSVTAMSVCQTGVCRIAAGDSAATARIFEVPLRRIKFSAADLDF